MLGADPGEFVVTYCCAIASKGPERSAAGNV